MAKRAIPAVPADGSPSRRNFDASVKETLELLTGVRGTRINTLGESASLSDVISKINEIIRVMQ